MAAPFECYTLKTREAFRLDANLSRVIDKVLGRGNSLSVSVNVHARIPWYAGLYGQQVNLTAGPVTPADGLGIYVKQDFSGFGLLNSPTFLSAIDHLVGLVDASPCQDDVSTGLIQRPYGFMANQGGSTGN